MKLLAYIGLFLFIAGGCTKDVAVKNAQVKVRLDYIGTGGYYTDDIDGVPNGLVIGTNGPFTVDPNKKYTLRYKASNSYNELKIEDWSPTTDRVWVIRCYVSNNIARIETYYE